MQNKLIHEKSPYLLQHAHNPVEWYPWGEEAFAKARSEKKLIFLSIGYSTCHWCHVMAHESFEDEEVAQVLNESFVAIKVDREERPDIDAVYMEVCQILTRQGGWPLTILMTPEQKPVFVGTYFPKRRKYGHLGLIELLNAFAEAWKKDPGHLEQESEKITAYLYEDRREKTVSVDLDKNIFKKAEKQFESIYDAENGGFGAAPKFPTPHNLLFLMRYAMLSGQHTVEANQDMLDLNNIDRNDADENDFIKNMAYKTLEMMYRGGIFDHIGGGFSRYSTDERWLVPHFEKMLYDNALLTYAYLEAYQISKKELFRIAAEKTLTYVMQTLTSEEGGFYCGEDADSEGEEGKFYLFTKKEILDVLGKTDGEIYCKWYGITENGNFEGKNIPNLLDNPDYEMISKQAEEMNEKLADYRKNRMKLHRDDKILTSWNGLMIAAFAKAYQILGKTEYLQAAVCAETFVREKMSSKDGRLRIRYREGECAGDGQLNDYAFMAWAEIELYKTVFDTEYLKRAAGMCEWIMELFYDKERLGFYFYASDAEQLIYRPKEMYDGAVPSGNGVAAYVFVQLAHLTGEMVWTERAEAQIQFLAGEIQEYPMGYTFSLLAFLQELYAHRELVVTVRSREMLEPFKCMLREHENTNLGILVKTEKNAEELAKLCPYTEPYLIEDEAVYYLCQDGACMQPVRNIEELSKILG